MGDDITRETTQYGFAFGALRVDRMCEWDGGVSIRVYTKHRSIVIRSSPKGQVLEVVEERRSDSHERSFFDPPTEGDTNVE